MLRLDAIVSGLGRPRVAFAVVACASAWLCATAPVFSQEAYYWSYAQHPDLSYFDHPPMVAWLIWAGTQLFGDGAVGIRFGTWTCGLVATWGGALLLREFGLGSRAQSAWILLSLAVPILAMTHFLANPDAPLVASWTLVMLALWRARRGATRWWAVAGTAAGCALLSKYSAIFLAVNGVLLFAFDRVFRRQLLRPAPYLAVLVAFAVFLPVVVWNVQHDFESFRFQTESRFAQGGFGLKWLPELIGLQLLVVHPVLAVAIGFAVVWLARRARTDPRAMWLLAFGLPLPTYMILSSLWIQVKVNWLAPGYVPLLLGVVVWWSEHMAGRMRPLVVARIACSLLVVPVAVLFAPAFRLVPSGRGSSWVGWDELAAHAEKWEEQVDAGDAIEGNVFFFAADYKDAAQLARGLKLLWHRQVDGVADLGEPTLAQNVLGQHALQFDHWTDPVSRIGQDAVFVLPRADDREEMVRRAAARFASIERVEHVEIERWGLRLMQADIYVCRGYRGPDPHR